jgi:NTP pyrophosphatase (non-canonical NTP hydrolase)
MNNINYDAHQVDLLLGDLNDANIARLPQFKNKHGQPAHSEPDGSDWSLGEWMCALAGEVGEAANIIKKIQRGDLEGDEGRELLAKELADIQTYLSILAFRANINLAKATIDKFNEVSERVGSGVRL